MELALQTALPDIQRLGAILVAMHNTGNTAPPFAKKRKFSMSLKLHGIEACVFDAYGTLFDVNSAARTAQDSLGDKWQPLAELWRTKQLQYTWLRGLAERHADFWHVTGDALDFAMSACNSKTRLCAPS
jgi:hypothetical protein